jgi:hypothetical protein
MGVASESVRLRVFSTVWRSDAKVLRRFQAGDLHY